MHAKTTAFNFVGGIYNEEVNGSVICATGNFKVHMMLMILWNGLTRDDIIIFVMVGKNFSIINRWYTI